jgi:hypothetical protein
VIHTSQAGCVFLCYNIIIVGVVNLAYAHVHQIRVSLCSLLCTQGLKMFDLDSKNFQFLISDSLEII